MKRVGIILLILVAIGWLGFMIFMEEVMDNFIILLIITPIFYVIFEIIYIRRKHSFLDCKKIKSFKDFMYGNLDVVVITFMASFILSGLYFMITKLKVFFKGIGDLIIGGKSLIGKIISSIGLFFFDNKIIVIILIVISGIIGIKYLIYIIFVRSKR